jgi:hypothetical protein
MFEVPTPANLSRNTLEKEIAMSSNNQKSLSEQGRLLSPELELALRELAACEQLPLAALVSVLINEALTCRLDRKPRAGWKSSLSRALLGADGSLEGQACGP